MGRRLIIDLEGDGLLRAVPSRGIKEVSQFWCNAAIDIDTGEELYWGPPVPRGHKLWTPLLGNPTGSIEDSYKAFAEADLLLAHNGIGYDYPALEKLASRYAKPNWQRPSKAWDTMVIAKTVWPYDSLFGPDLKLAAKLDMSPKDKARFIKSHSLKAWGIRTGTHKQDYDGGFDAWSPEMASYLMDDVRATLALWQLIKKRTGPDAEVSWPESVFETECETARIIYEQQEDGIRFDVDKAQSLAAELTNEKARLETQLVETFGEWWVASKPITPTINRSVTMDRFPDVTVRRFSEKTGKELKPYVGPPKCHYSTDAPYVPIERVRFNPGSRDHLGQRLQAVFGWKPKKFGANGKPTVDESVLEEIPEAVMPATTRKLILNYFVVNKTLGMLANGSKAWLHQVRRHGDEYGTDNRIHGKVDTCGAITGRGTHKDPNLSQVPSVATEKGEDGKDHTVKGLEGRYGWECRELFIADEGWQQTGVDASALELIDLGHYLVPYDEGKFRDRVCDPSRDPHTEHSELTGTTRKETKTTTYLYIFGGSAYKLSLDTEVEPHEVPELLGYRGLPMMLKNLERRFDTKFVDGLDDTQKARIAKARKIILAFEHGIEGIKDLKESVSSAAQRGWLRGMDGRRLHVRKPHAALNTLLQSAGAQTCKLWMVLTHRKLSAKGLVRGRDFKQILWVHDELQFTHKPGLHEIIRECAYEAMEEAGVLLGLRGTYRADAKLGMNWAETH